MQIFFDLADCHYWLRVPYYGFAVMYGFAPDRLAAVRIDSLSLPTTEEQP